MSLRPLSDVELLNRITRLTRCERAFTLRALACLIEIEHRKLHFALGYSSMFTFCTLGLGYSGSAAGRRIQTARAAARFPEVMALLQANDVNVCTVSRVARFLTPDNKDEILTRIRRKSLDEVIAIAAEYRPPSDVILDRVRDVMVAPPRSPLLESMPWRQPAALPAPRANAPDTTPVPEISIDAPNANPPSPPGDASSPSPPAGDLERRIILRFGVSPEFMAKLDRFRSLAWHRLPANATLEHVFELVLDDMLKRSDPVLRREQRSRRELVRTETEQTAPFGADDDAGSSTDAPRGPRQIPLRVRDDVFARDRGQCTFVGPDGRRCDATWGLQIDHILPVAQGGGGEIGNLRLLCAQHNRLLAERLLGARDVRPH
ncbi:MAG TPA: HNH endonuclease signature motif containing protein, partial [Candidatus Krumholzibacteria bacterium]|nr:HNH endonuclease signature motif containing protein [Candidatus Krumholzibacteria bacterium]